MSRFPRFRPSQRMLPRWIMYSLIVMGVCGLVSLNLWLPFDPITAHLIGNAYFYSVVLIIVGIGMLVDRAKKLRQVKRWRDSAHDQGLQFDPQVREAVLEPFLDSPLFRFGSRGDANVHSHTWGTIDGRAFSLVNYRHRGKYRTRKMGTRRLAFEQTVALVLDVGLPDFHLTPHENDWTGNDPAWPKTLDLGEVVEIVNPLANSPAVLRAKDVAVVRELFGSRRVHRRMGKLAGWTIESCNGNLVIYFHGDQRKYDELPEFIKTLTRVINTLCKARSAGGEASAADETEPSALPPMLSQAVSERAEK